MKPKPINGLCLDLKDEGMTVASSKAYRDIKRLLSSNPALLDLYVSDHVSLGSLQCWMDKKQEQLIQPTTPEVKVSQWKVSTNYSCFH